MSGLVHTKPGGYKERVSDVVNDPGHAGASVLTDASPSAPADDESGSGKRCPTMIVRIEDIHFIDRRFEDQRCPGHGGTAPVPAPDIEH